MVICIWVVNIRETILIDYLNFRKHPSSSPNHFPNPHQSTSLCRRLSTTLQNPIISFSSSLLLSMSLQLWETLKEAIPAYTGLTPSTFFTVVALGIALYYLATTLFGGPSHHEQHLRSRSFEPEMEPLPPPVQLGEVTEEELKAYDGTDSKKPLLMAIKGQIYDVTQSRLIRLIYFVSLKLFSS